MVVEVPRWSNAKMEVRIDIVQSCTYMLQVRYHTLHSTIPYDNCCCTGKKVMMHSHLFLRNCSRGFVFKSDSITTTGRHFIYL